MAGTLVGMLALGVKAEFDQFRRDLRDGASKAGDEAGQTLGARIKARLTAANVGATIGATLGALGVGALKLADVYDKAMDTIRIGTGATGDALKSLEADFQAVAGRVPDDIGTVATVIADLNTRTGQTGEGLQSLAKQILDLTRLTGGDAATNVASLTRLFGDWSVASEDQSGALDKVFRASQATGIGVDALAQAMVQFGAPLRNIGFSFDEAAAMLAKWEKEGVNTTLALGGLKIALGEFAKEGIDAKEGLGDLVDRIVNAETAAEAMALGVRKFGSRAGPDMVAAIREGRFAIEDYVDVVANGSDTIATATEDTEGWGEAIGKLKNQVAVAVGPIVKDFADLAAELGNLVFLLPALAGALGHGLGALWTKAGGSAAVRAAAAAAGSVAGLVYHGAAFLAQPFVAAASALWSTLGGPRALAAIRSVGILGGTTFGTAFRLAAIAGIAALLYLAWQEFLNFQETVTKAQDDLQGKVDEAVKQTGTEAIANLRNTTKYLNEVQGAARVLGDTFAGAQQVEGLRNLAIAIGRDASLTADQVEEALDLLADASHEALSRGNEEIAGDIDAIAETLRTGGAGTLPASLQDVYDRLSAIEPPELEPPQYDPPIPEVYEDARQAIIDGFGSIKQALKDPPRIIAPEERLDNMERRMRRVMRNLKRAVEADDPFAVDYWTKAAAKQQDSIDRMKGHTAIRVKDIRKAFREAGVEIDGTWLATGRTVKGLADQYDVSEKRIARILARNRGNVDATRDRLEALRQKAKDVGEEDPTVTVTAPGLQGVIDKVTSLRAKLGSLYGTDIGISIRGAPGGPIGMQHGGDTLAGMLYRVNETHTEYFVPSRAGRIEPYPVPLSAEGAPGGGGNTFNLEVHGAPTRPMTPVEIMQQMRRGARMGLIAPRRRRGWAGAGG